MEEKTKGLKSEILSLISSYFKNGDYQIQLNKYAYDSNGYCDGFVIIGGVSFRCSFNKGGYMCWFANWNRFFEDDEQMNRKLCREASEMIDANYEEEKKKRIEKLEKELKLLKGE